MLVKIRKGMFETNSSSAHVLVIRRTNLNDDLDVKSEIRDKITSRYEYVVASLESELEFERYPFKLLTSINDKIRYLTAYYRGDKSQEILRILQKYCPECRTLLFPHTEKYNYYDPITNVEIPSDCLEFGEKEGGYRAVVDNRVICNVIEKKQDIPYYGYIDHESYGLIDNAIEKKKDLTLEDVIVNKTIFIVIDGDEYLKWHYMGNAGLINPKEIIFEYSTDSLNIVKEIEKKCKR